MKIETGVIRFYLEPPSITLHCDAEGPTTGTGSTTLLNMIVSTYIHII